MQPRPLTNFLSKFGKNLGKIGKNPVCIFFYKHNVYKHTEPDFW